MLLFISCRDGRYISDRERQQGCCRDGRYIIYKVPLREVPRGVAQERNSTRRMKSCTAV